MNEDEKEMKLDELKDEIREEIEKTIEEAEREGRPFAVLGWLADGYHVYDTEEEVSYCTTYETNKEVWDTFAQQYEDWEQKGGIINDFSPFPLLDILTDIVEEEARARLDVLIEDEYYAGDAE